MSNLHTDNEVSNYIANLDEPMRSLAYAVRSAIATGTSNNIGEHIKWNVPAFYYTKSFENYNAKSYLRDLAVMNFRQKNCLLLIFPNGELIKKHVQYFDKNRKDSRRFIRLEFDKDNKEMISYLPAILNELINEIDIILSK